MRAAIKNDCCTKDFLSATYFEWIPLLGILQFLNQRMQGLASMPKIIEDLY